MDKILRDRVASLPAMGTKTMRMMLFMRRTPPDESGTRLWRMDMISFNSKGFYLVTIYADTNGEMTLQDKTCVRSSWGAKAQEHERLLRGLNRVLQLKTKQGNPCKTDRSFRLEWIEPIPNSR